MQKFRNNFNAHIVKKTQTYGTKTKNVVSAHGHLTVRQRYRYYPHRVARSYPLETQLENDNTYTKPLNFLAARCCEIFSYRVAEENIRQLCGISLSYTLLDTLAEQMNTLLQRHPEIKKSFQHAEGESMFGVDGTSVHTRNADGTNQWREMKVGVFAKRERGKSALPEVWDKRKLPKPAAASAFAMIAESEEFQERCQQERRRLGVGSVTTTVGDGAKWIWNLAQKVFGKTEECLDIFHTLEHISDCGKELYDVSEEATIWLERMRLILLSEGFGGMERESQKLRKGLKEPRRKPVDSLLRYLEGNKRSDELL